MSDRERHPAIEVLHGRISATAFDPDDVLSEETIRELVEDANQAPSSFNIQHWRFICVRDPGLKKRLRKLAHNQAPAEKAAVTFIILGDLRGHEKLGEILERSVEAGVIGRRTAESWVKQSNRIYADDEMARDEAIRSATLAAANLMISAAARGLVSAPMIGFDPKGVCEEFDIGDRHLPVMLLAVGHPADGNTPRKIRLAVDEVLAFDRCREF